MYETIKFSNVRKNIAGGFIALFQNLYNRRKLISISPYIKEYVYAKSKFPTVYEGPAKQVEFHGPTRSISYDTMLFGQALRMLYRERERITLANGKYSK